MELEVCPSTLQRGYAGYSPTAIAQLFNGEETSPYLDIDIEKDIYRDRIASNMDRISVSGVQEKMSAVVDKGKIRLAEEGERSYYILKPAPLDYGLSLRKQIPANEHLTMQIASQVYGIMTACNALCFDKRGRKIYITKRFDILPDGQKTPMEDFAVLIGKEEETGGKYYKYEGTYEDIALAIKREITAWPKALHRLLHLVTFNYIYGNGDAHLKNFSLQLVNGEFTLSPAYDLMNTALHINGEDFALSGGLLNSGVKSEVNLRTGHACRKDFEIFGIAIGIHPEEVKKILDEYMHVPDKAKALIDNSYLDAKTKRSYLRIVEQRTKRFTRQSD